MVVQHNINAMTAYNKLNVNVTGLKKSSEKLASGYRINRAGDDAAGLAISEKMRSQIKGLNQAVRNSQDGINMIQTFEGAATNTHEILQRMKVLAEESANGTYDNATDRAALQLEFDQLNEELNQIADTDFNGTVALNGGKMADGTRAVDGEFNYENPFTDADVALAATDISGKYSHSLADQSFYNKAAADAVWNAVGASLDKYGSLEVTMMYDGEKWNAETVMNGADHSIQENLKASGLTIKPVDRKDANGKGGFEVWAGNTKVTNVIFDETDIKEGDTITLSFTNAKAGTFAPDNVGLDECYDSNSPYKITPDDEDTDLGLNASALNGKISVKLDDSLTDSAMTETIKKALDALDDAKITATYENGVVTGYEVAASDKGLDVTGLEIDKNGNITYTPDGAAEAIKLGKITAQDLIAKNPAQAAKAEVASTGNTKVDADKADLTKLAQLFEGRNLTTDGADQNVTLTYEALSGNWTVTGDKSGAITTIANTDLANYFGTDVVSGTPNNGDTITVKYINAKSPSEAGDITANGTVEFSLNIDAYNVTDLSTLKVHSVATPAAATMEGKLGETVVSKADAFDNSTARMTYTDHVILQTGARTKDAVDFTFKYNTDGSADMGGLKANLNISARADGLNTENLSLANQKDANYAIDQIDKAINKVSMIRATFGSIQNRLEYKIDNLTTTSTNLQEAESNIRDTDMAQEMMNYTKYSILQQAAQSMLAQANQQPQSILQLLG